MLSAEVILRMDDESVRRLASESTEITDKRDSLQQTLDVLTRGLNTIRRQASLEPEGMFNKGLQRAAVNCIPILTCPPR